MREELTRRRYDSSTAGRYRGEREKCNAIFAQLLLAVRELQLPIFYKK